MFDWLILTTIAGLGVIGMLTFMVWGERAMSGKWRLPSFEVTIYVATLPIFGTGLVALGVISTSVVLTSALEAVGFTTAPIPLGITVAAILSGLPLYVLRKRAPAIFGLFGVAVAGTGFVIMLLIWGSDGASPWLGTVAGWVGSIALIVMLTSGVDDFVGALAKRNDVQPPLKTDSREALDDV